MITFDTKINVPPHTIREIGNSIRNRVIKEIEDLYLDYKRDHVTLTEIDGIIQHVVNSYASSHDKKSNEGWILEESVVYDIATELLHHRKIMAIKRFREATRTGLKDSKHFIDKFGTGITAHEDFIVAMT